jgi:dephospho-CoA kinase
MSTHQDKKYTLYESALLFESGFIQYFDKSILVTAPIELALSRVMARDGISKSDVMARVNMQKADHEKAVLANFIISNDESEALIPKVLDIHNTLKLPASS